MADIVISEFMNDDAVEVLAADFDVLYEPALCEREDALAEALGDCRALIVRNRTRVSATLLDDGPDLVAIGRLGVGLDNIDLEACKERGVRVFPATGANLVAVAEYVIAAIHQLLRGVCHCTQEVLAGEWPRNRAPGREVDGKVLGIVGFGSIGRAVAARAHPLGMRVIAYDPHVSPQAREWAQYGASRCETLEEVLGQSDVVSLHLPLLPPTRDLIDATAIGAMQPGACLINTSRGGLIDEEALVAALESGHLSGAALDVFKHEPLPAGSLFEGVPNLMLTPHIAGMTEEANRRVGTSIAAQIREALS